MHGVQGADDQRFEQQRGMWVVGLLPTGGENRFGIGQIAGLKAKQAAFEFHGLAHGTGEECSIEEFAGLARFTGATGGLSSEKQCVGMAGSEGEAATQLLTGSGKVTPLQGSASGSLVGPETPPSDPQPAGETEQRHKNESDHQLISPRRCGHQASPMHERSRLYSVANLKAKERASEERFTPGTGRERDPASEQ